eukprot:6667768-Pyramimonas_sp.AAC.1
MARRDAGSHPTPLHHSPNPSTSPASTNPGRTTNSPRLPNSPKPASMPNPRVLPLISPVGPLNSGCRGAALSPLLAPTAGENGACTPLREWHLRLHRVGS